MIDQKHYSFSETFADVTCGVSVRDDIVSSGVAHVRVGKGDLASAFFGIDNHRVVDTLTNEANGNFVQVERNEIIHDIQATHVSGSVFMFTTIAAASR